MFGNNKPFGTASAFGGGTFGSTSTPFGQPAGSTAFGAKPATANVFGTSTFGTSSGGGMFGSTAPSTSTGLFGQTSTAFGQPAPASGSFAFGAGASTSSGLFGTSAPATQSPGLFGGSSTSAFGAPRPAFGGFGTTSTGSGLFGQNTSTGTGLFGTSGGFAPTATNGTTIKFNPLAGTDTMMKAGVTQNINTHHQCITCMKEYENKSLEELRLEDYLANRKGPQSGTIGGFGTPAAQPGLFGNNAASTSGFSFGTQQQNKPLFGTATGTTNTFGGTGTGLFGGQPAQQQNTNIFGKSVGFGTATTAAAPNFSFGNTAGNNLFGQTNQQKPLFGQPTSNSGLFGQSTTTPATGFGTSSAFGGFGATSQPSVGLFAAKPTGTATTNAFNFGNSTANTGTLFGQKPASTFGSTSGFGTTNTFGPFGGTQTTNTGLFGQPKPAVSGFGTTGTGFGTGLGTGFGTMPFTSMGMNTTGTGTGLFGSTLTTNKPAFNFSGTGTTGFNFGQPSGTGTGFNFGGSSVPLGVNSSDQNQLNALQQQLQARQVSAFTSNPFGDNPLFQISMKDSKKREEILKPTNPAAQKAVLTNSQYKISPLPSAKVKPKPLTPASCAKVSLFDGLEDEEPCLGNTRFIPKRSVKKLVMKSQSKTSSFTVMSNVSSAGQATEISFSTSIVLEKSPPAARDGSRGDSVQNAPLTVDIADRNASRQSHEVQAVAKTSTSDVQPETLYIKKMLPTIAKSSSNISLNDTIEALHTKPAKLSYQSPTSSSPDNQRTSCDSAILSPASSSDTECDPVTKLEPENKKHGTGISLTRKGYYTIPSMEQLLHIMDDDGTCMVQDFVVAREGYGKVCFLGELNVANLNLDEIVSFRKKEITVYPDDKHKPPIGVELNREAEVTLECVWPTDKTNHSPITDPNRLSVMGYQEKIEKTTARLGAKFVNYKPETGSWVFKVDHFSKYGLEDSDDESDDTDPKLLAANNSKKGPDLSKKIQQPVPKDSFLSSSQTTFKPKAKQLKISSPVEDDDDEMQDAEGVSYGDNVFSPLQHLVAAGMDAERIQGMKASFFMDDSEDKWGEEDIEMREPIARFGSMKATGKFPKPVPVKKTVMETMERSFSKCNFSFMEEPKTPSTLLLAKAGREQSKTASIITAAREEIWSAYPVISPVSVSPPKLMSMRIARPDVNRTITLRPYGQSLLFEKQKCLADMGFFMGRSFRIGWGPKSVLLHLGHVQGYAELDDGAQNCSVFSTMSLPQRDVGLDYKPFTLSISKIEVINEVPVDKLIKKNLVESLEIQLDNCKSFIEDGTPIFVPNPGIESLHAHAKLSQKHVRRMETTHGDAAFVNQCNDVWELCVALWGEIPGLETDKVISTYAQQMARREALSNWLIKTTKEKALSEINSHNYEPNSSFLSTIFSHLSVREIGRAVLLAQESGDYYLATILAQAEGNAIVRRLISKQLMEWEKSEAYNYISPQRLKLYCLLAGVMMWNPSKVAINCCEGIDWRRTLALHLWYYCLPTSDVRDVVAEYENSFSNPDLTYRYAGPPIPSYQGDSYDEPENGQSPVLDTCFHLLKLYCDRSYRLDKLLMPEASTPAHMDYRLSWLLHQALTSVGYCHLPAQEASSLHIDFASQLEAMGLWHWAVFVSLHFSCPHIREKLVKDLLLRHVSLEDTDSEKKRENFLQEKLLIPSEWIYQAKAIKAHSFGKSADEAWYLLKAGRWSESHEIVLSQLAADAIINEDFEYLLKFLNELSVPERSQTILDWACGGQVFLDYIHVSQMVVSVVKGEVSACDVEKLQPEVVSLCHRLSSLQCRSAKDRLCQSEMAKKTATLLRSIFTFQADRSGDAAAIHTLTPHIKSLPMPEDYALQELRALTRSYFTAVASGIN